MKNHIEVVEYDPAWADAYGRAAARVGRALGDRLERVEHIGSTAVPGLGAKPIVDLRVMVGADEALEDCVTALASATNFEYVADMDHWKVLGREVAEVPESERFPEDGDAVRAYNLHLTHVDGDDWPENVRLRDYLRDHADAREEYAAVKREAAREHPDDVEAYTEAKDEMVASLLARAREAGYEVRR
jgi:GrpB-like predicted nucleotidyltransferase (UPF0157 family)